jgi:hypothetical protein
MVKLHAVGLGEVERFEDGGGVFIGREHTGSLEGSADGIGGEDAFAPGGANSEAGLFGLEGIAELGGELLISLFVVEFIHPAEPVEHVEAVIMAAPHDVFHGGAVLVVGLVADRVQLSAAEVLAMLLKNPETITRLDAFVLTHIA